MQYNMFFKDFNNFINSSLYKEHFSNAKKFYVIAPARSFTTTLINYMNLNGNTGIFNEARFDRMFHLKSLDRAEHYTNFKLNRNIIEALVNYVKENNIEKIKLIGYLTLKNDYLWNILINSGLIGNKDPLLQQKINTKFLIEEFFNTSNFKFGGILRTNPKKMYLSFGNLNNEYRHKDEKMFYEFLKILDDFYAFIIKFIDIDASRFYFTTDEMLFKEKNKVIENFLKFNDVEITYNYNKKFEDIKKDLLKVLNKVEIGNSRFIVHGGYIVKHHHKVVSEIKDYYKDIKFEFLNPEIEKFFYENISPKIKYIVDKTKNNV